MFFSRPDLLGVSQALEEKEPFIKLHEAIDIAEKNVKMPKSLTPKGSSLLIMKDSISAHIKL